MYMMWPPKKAKFVPPIPKEPMFSMGEVIEDGTMCSLVPEMRAVLERQVKRVPKKRTSSKSVTSPSLDLDDLVSSLEDKLDIIIEENRAQHNVQEKLWAILDLMSTDLHVVADHVREKKNLKTLGPIPDSSIAWKLIAAELAFKANLVDLVGVEDQDMPESEEENASKGKGKEKEVVEDEEDEVEKGDHLPSDLSELDRNP
ncbi:hypothetical protein Clacol_000885 [Clathrus columnatus]|uniref:Uncharacterized protein n=1 Tax=Clathrus columnatus TaxID=1419009 RepID=A0AAV4ZXY9_9AGAM|nr:hypothetical protein Clacol_000885 [Clathrus columnatus]